MAAKQAMRSDSIHNSSNGEECKEEDFPEPSQNVSNSQVKMRV